LATNNETQIMSDPITSKPIPNKISAKAVHTELQERGASPYEFGLFYRAILNDRLWRSQVSLAKELGVSPGKVSQQLPLAGLPASVVAAMGGPAHISRRVGQALLSAIETFGEHAVEIRAQAAKDVGYTSIDDLLHFVITNQLPERDKSSVKVRISRDRKALRIETPIAARLMPHIGKFEGFMSTVLAIFEHSIRAEAAEALRQRNAQRRKPGSTTQA
jgi:hypothetical protein